MTVGTVATALAAAIISLSSANLGAIGAVASGSTTIFSLDPSMNLHVSIYRFSIAKKKKKPFIQLLPYLMLWTCGYSSHVLCTTIEVQFTYLASFYYRE